MNRRSFVFVFVFLFSCGNAWAGGVHPDLKASPDLSGVDLGEQGQKAAMLFRCPCPGKDALKLSESGCDCEAAVSARTDLSNTIAAESASNEKALNAQLNGILESLEGSPELKRFNFRTGGLSAPLGRHGLYAPRS